MMPGGQSGIRCRPSTVPAMPTGSRADPRPLLPGVAGHRLQLLPAAPRRARATAEGCRFCGVAVRRHPAAPGWFHPQRDVGNVASSIDPATCAASVTSGCRCCCGPSRADLSAGAAEAMRGRRAASPRTRRVRRRCRRSAPQRGGIPSAPRSAPGRGSSSTRRFGLLPLLRTRVVEVEHGPVVAPGRRRRAASRVEYAHAPLRGCGVTFGAW